jgi:hypothetical protein
VASLKAERETWRAELNQLTGELREARLHGESTERLYRLLKGVLGLEELRQAARSALANQWPEGVKGAEPPVEPAGSADETKPPDEGKASTVDDAHRHAARAARVMVADLFLYNAQLSEPGLTEDQIRGALERDYQGARQTFRSRVSPRIWQATDYLEVEFEREIRKRVESAARHHEAPSPASPEPDDPPGDGNQASLDAAWEPTPDAPDPPPPPLVEDEEQVKARRVARVLVADVLLYHAKVIVPGITEERVRTALSVELKAARETFESRVPERVRAGQDYLAIEFERALRNRGVHPAPEPSTSAQPQTEVDLNDNDDDQQHQRAASLARLLIAQLLIENWHQVEAGVRDRNLLTVLDEKCKAARQAFESRVPSRIWEETHYFEVQLEQLLWELQGGPLDTESERQLNDFVSIVGAAPEEGPT